MSQSLTVKPASKGAWTWGQGFLTLTCRPDAHVKLENFAKRLGLSLDNLLEARMEAE